MMLPTSTHRTAFGWLCSSFRLFWGFNVVSFVLFSIASASPTLHDASFAPDRILRVTSGTHTQSCITKSGVGFVNGSSPGPEVRIMEGQTTWIRVYNDMVDQNLTMHWHGLSMAVSPFSDGTPAAAQWPIPPGYFFDYELHPAVGQAGTYFYHSHVDFQAVSIAGPLIVEDSGKVPYHYDEELVIFLQDVFNLTGTNITAGLEANPFVWSGETANVMVNGKGQLSGAPQSPSCELASLNVKPDTTYRVRFIGGTGLSFVSLGFEDHSQLTIIEADGQYTQPYTVDYLQVASGQRFSVLFTTKCSDELTKQQYFLQIETRERPTLTRAYAILNYASQSVELPAPATPPLSLPNQTYGWLDYTLRPLVANNGFPSASEVTRRITVRMHQVVNGTIIWAEDQYPWTASFPKEPYLVSLYKNDGVEFPSMERALNNSGIDPVTRTFPAQIGEVLEIVLQNTGSDSGGLDAHGWHAHGAHYYDIGSGNGTYDPVANEARLKGTQPVLRDTTLVYRYETATTPGLNAGWRAWRLRVTEPGVWMIHCHILQHMIMGMQTVWVMGNETELLTIPKPDVTGYLTYGGSVYGNATYSPSVVHQFPPK